MPYAIYLRKSRADAEAEARGEGETLARHEAVLLELAKRQNLNITEIYKEVVSGDTIAARPVMQKLLNEVGQGLWDGVLVMEVERLARGDTIDQGIVAQTFKYGDTKIITPVKIYNPNNEFDEEYFEFGLFMARREYKTINRRLQNGRIASAKEGKFVSSIAPYGYKRVKIPDEKGYTLEIIPENAEVVRLIFALYTEGELCEDGSRRRLGIQSIARKLNSLGIPPIRHDYWQKETIINILNNPTYAGKIRWGYRKQKKKIIDGNSVISRPINYDEFCIISKGKHEPIINESVFDLAQYYISKIPPAPVGYKSQLKNPLAGIIICGKCGRKMVLRKGYNNKPDYIVCHARTCDNVSSPFNLVEKRIISSLHQWLGEYKLKWKSPKKAENNVSHSVLIKSLNTLESEIATLTKQLSSTHDLLEQGIYTIEQFLDRSRSIAERIKKSKTDYASIEKELNLEFVRDESRRTIIPKIELLLDVYGNLLTASDKNSMLKDILEKAIYTKTKHGGYRGVSPDDFSLIIYPKIP